VKTTIYMPKGVAVMIGSDLQEGVVARQTMLISEPLTVYIDTESEEIVIDTNHTPPKGWASQRRQNV